jgi:hypothetical protein
MKVTENDMLSRTCNGKRKGGETMKRKTSNQEEGEEDEKTS